MIVLLCDILWKGGNGCGAWGPTARKIRPQGQTPTRNTSCKHEPFLVCITVFLVICLARILVNYVFLQDAFHSAAGSMLQPTCIGFFGFCFLADFPTALHEFNQQQTTSTASTLFLNNNLTTTPLLSSSSSQHSVASRPSKIQSPRSHYSRPWNPSFLSVFSEVSFSTPAFKKPKGTVATTETWTLAKQKTITPPKSIPSHCQLSRRRPTKTFLIRTHGKKPERLPIFVPSTPGISQTTSCRHPSLIPAHRPTLMSWDSWRQRSLVPGQCLSDCRHDSWHQLFQLTCGRNLESRIGTGDGFVRAAG